MNKKIVAASLAFSSLLLCGSAMAADVKLVFKGEVSPSTCAIVGDNGSGEYVKAVELPTVSTRALAKQNDVAGRKPIELKLHRWADILCLYCLTKQLVFDKGVISDENPVGRFGRIYPC